MTGEPIDPVERKKAEDDARLYGTGFIKGGQRMAPENVFLITAPDTGSDYFRRRFVDGSIATMKVDCTILDDRFINMTTTHEDGYYRRQFAHRLIDTQEKAIRDALIALGWTPPA